MAKKAICQRVSCKKHISMSRLRRNAKYCSMSCKQMAANGRVAERKARTEDRLLQERRPAPQKGAKREGAMYRALLADEELVGWLRHGTVSQSMVAHQFGVSPAEVSRAWATYLDWEKVEATRSEWEPSWLAKLLLPQAQMERLYELGPEGAGTAEFGELADHCARVFGFFSRFFFVLEGKRPIVKGFHTKWIRSIIVAWATGGKQMILSPPRHGKSEMLIRFCVWMISMFPNIRIMWMAANSDVAGIMLGAVKDHLSNNKGLLKATLPPGTKYEPARNAGRPWSSSEIKIAQMNIVGQKSSTLLALGRDSEVLSRDLDILIVDDLESFKTTREPAQRRKSKGQFAEVGTRKEERTCWVNICSRQHPDDIPNSLMKASDDQRWKIIVETAHEPCQLDADVIAGHDDNGCVLFPEVRTYRWLTEKKHEMEALGIPGAYEMRFLNITVPETGLVFFVDTIREHLDRSRDLGVKGLPAGTLVGGLDPAARATQAAFCWHWAPPALSMVDLVTQEAGGFAGAHRIMREWHTAYGLMYWFYEDNSGQIEFFKDPRTKALAEELNLVIKPHTTGENKQDPELGISSMAPWFHDGKIVLPYGTNGARMKVNAYLRQLETWTTDGVMRGKHRPSDIKMASWFPFPTIVKWNAQDGGITLQVGRESSYPGVTSFSDAPWNQTNYPGG